MHVYILACFSISLYYTPIYKGDAEHFLTSGKKHFSYGFNLLFLLYSASAYMIYIGSSKLKMVCLNLLCKKREHFFQRTFWPITYIEYLIERFLALQLQVFYYFVVPTQIIPYLFNFKPFYIWGYRVFSKAFIRIVLLHFWLTPRRSFQCTPCSQVKAKVRLATRKSSKNVSQNTTFARNLLVWDLALMNLTSADHTRPSNSNYDNYKIRKKRFKMSPYLIEPENSEPSSGPLIGHFVAQMRKTVLYTNTHKF